MKQFTVDDKMVSVQAFGNAANAPVIYCLTGEDLAQQLPELEHMLIPAIQHGRCQPFRLLWWSPVNWNRDYSPWPAPPLSAQDQPFPGEAKSTLAWLTKHLAELQQPALDGVGPEQRYLLGYSLGGLCALWLLHECDLFAGCASCSGSLWYDGWIGYLQTHTVSNPNSRLYLSLGKKEEKARNPRMATVGEATKTTYALLRQDKNVAETTLQWHEGGHFTDIPQRLAQAVLWLMRM